MPVPKSELKTPADAEKPGAGALAYRSVRSHVGGTLESTVLATLRAGRAGRRKAGLVEVQTLRFRPKGEQMDRKFIVESSLDPLDETAVILRVSPASDAELPPHSQMLTTQQAAEVMNVSRPYVAQLVDKGRFDGVERTQAGHRRIPLAEVERVHLEMKGAMRQAIRSIEDTTSELRQRELDAARVKSKKRWVAKPGA